MKKLTLVSLLILIGCSTIAYQDDLGFLDSAQANSYEFPIKIGSTICKDMNGNVGLCSTRWANNKDLVINLDAQPYAYTYVLTCSSALNVNHSESISSNKATSITIPFMSYGSLLEFTCIVQIFPSDRTAVSAQGQVRVVLFDPNYQPREQMYLYKSGLDNYLVLGQYALHSYVCDSGKCSSYKKKTAVKVKSVTGLTAYSQSYQERFNFYGY